MKNKFNRDVPNTYQIIVNGTLDKKWINDITDMSVDYKMSTSGSISILTGEIIDQASLSGIINTLINNRNTIISITRI